jgi:hypothetical protein
VFLSIRNNDWLSTHKCLKEFSQNRICEKIKIFAATQKIKTAKTTGATQKNRSKKSANFMV